MGLEAAIIDRIEALLDREFHRYKVKLVPLKCGVSEHPPHNNRESPDRFICKLKFISHKENKVYWNPIYERYGNSGFNFRQQNQRYKQRSWDYQCFSALSSTR
jgi:hypothetical protein